MDKSQKKSTANHDIMSRLPVIQYVIERDFIELPLLTAFLAAVGIVVVLMKLGGA